MAEHRLATGESLSPDLIAQRAFTISRKGFDPSEVKAFLASAADTVRDLREQLRNSETARRSAEERALHPEIDEEMLLSAVGEETASILRSARAAASDIRARAEEQAAALLRDAQSRAETIRGDAEATALRATTDAEESAAAVRAQADADAEQGRAKADAEAEQVRAAAQHEAEAVRQLADQERKMTVEAAQQVREQILTDLTRRRRVANTQIEQLRAGRERLLEAYGVVRRTLDEVTDELQRAEGEARQAADEVGARAAGRPPDDLLFDLTAGPAERGVEPPTAPVPIPPPVPEATDEPTVTMEAVDLHDDPPDVVEPEAGGDGEGQRRMTESAIETGSSGPAPAGPSPGGGPESRFSVPTAERDSLRGAKGAQLLEAVDEVESVRIVSSAVDAPPRGERPKSSGRRGPVPVRGAPAGSRPEEVTGEPAAATLASEEAPGAGTPAVEGAPDQPVQGVDSLFARIRADRADAVVKARNVLDDQGGAAPPPEPIPPEPIPRDDSEPSVAAPLAGVEATDIGMAETAVADIEAAGVGVDETAVAETAVAGVGVDETAGAEAAEGDQEPLPDGDESYLQRRDEVTANIEVALSRRLKHALQDEQNDLLDRLRQVRGTPKAANLLGKPADHRGRYTTVARPYLAEAAGAGMGYAASFGSLEDAPVPAPNVDDLAVGLSSTLADPLRRRLQQAFAESAGDDQQVLIEAIGSVYRECKTQRIEQLAGDHVAAAFSRGSFEATPGGMQLRWLVEDLNGPCPDCDDNMLAGGLTKGDWYPTGQEHPPAHSGCRCILVPFEE